MSEKVSIIVPVYKAEQYLEECLKSILQQDYEDKEIILVDDGSPDGSPALCDTYANEYPEVRVIHQNNQGAGVSRNVGIEAATGEYICFVDADDRLDGIHAITALVECAKKEQADITVGSFRKLTEKGMSEVNYHHLQSEDTEAIEFRFKGFFQYGHLGFVWGKCYRKEFLERYKLRCTSVPFTEDKAMNLCCCVCRPRYAFVKESVYLYRVNEASASYRYRPELAQIWVHTAEHLCGFIEKNKITENYADLVAFHLFLGLFTVIQQEMQAGNTGVLAMTRALKAYGRLDIVAEYMKRLAKGQFVGNINSGMWKVIIWGASVMTALHGYFFIALGFKLLHVMKLDRKVIDSKYGTKECDSNG